MNAHFKKLIQEAGIKFDTDINDVDVCVMLPSDLETLIKLVAKECASVARDADLEDVDGGDSAVLRAAGNQIEQRFGV